MRDNATPKIGSLLDGTEGRDAIHFPIAPVTSEYTLEPGVHVSLVHGTIDRVDFNGEKIGIIDPFLTRPVQPGERCWLFLYPNTISDLRHVWSGEHDEATRQREWPAAKKWLVDFFNKAKEDEIQELQGYRDEYPDEYGDRPSAREEFESGDDNYVNTFERMMQQAKSCIFGSKERWESPEPFAKMVIYNSEWLCDALRRNHDEFWKNACIYFDVPLPEDIKEKGWFSCAC